MKVEGTEFPTSLRGVKVYSAPAEVGSDLIGRRFAKWDVGEWINSKPLTLDSLRGKVVLIRWWTAPGCPFCEASVPALNEFARKYHDRGVVVLGFYHHKSPAPLTVAHVQEQIRQLNLEFPVSVAHNPRPRFVASTRQLSNGFYASRKCSAKVGLASHEK